MSGNRRDWVLLVLALALAVLGLQVRLYLDREFEKLAPGGGPTEVGFIDGLLIEAGRDLAEESKQ